jgi:predicted metal-dependent phosphotriesterase family hydrolase
LETIAAVGEQSLILSSDAGQPRKSLPAELLRVFAQCLMEKGIAQEKIDRMSKDNPARLLRL